MTLDLNGLIKNIWQHFLETTELLQKKMVKFTFSKISNGIERKNSKQSGSRARGYKTFFILNSVEHEISKKLIIIKISRNSAGFF